MYYALTVPIQHNSLPAISAFAWAVASDAQLSHRKAYRLRLAIDEIVNNLIDHGTQARPQQVSPLHIFVEITPRLISVILEDGGSPYDITRQAPAVDVDAPLTERDIGGLGVFLVVRYIDDIRYDYVNGHNVNRLIMMRE